MPESKSPPSQSEIPGASGGSGMYIAGTALFAAAIAGLIYWKGCGAEPAKPVTPVATPQTAAPPTPFMDAPPPPPPPIEEVVDAGSDAATTPDKKPTGTGTGAGANGPCSKCGDGKGSAALSTALTGAAGGARGCYNRALRTTEVSGSLTVSVQVGSTGSVCSASIVNDSVGSSEISACVLGKFRGRAFPPPESGCVVVNIPISFTIKQ